MAQLNIDDYFDDGDDGDDGRRRRDEGMEKALQARARQAYKLRMQRWFETQPLGSDVFSDPMVREIGLPPGDGPYHHNIISAMFGAWVKAGRVIKTGRIYKPERPEAHARGGDHPIYRKVK